MQTNRSINRLEWVLGILLVVLLLAVVILSLLFWFRPEAPGTTAVSQSSNSATVIAQRADDIGPTPVFEGQTALVAYQAAQPIAQSWAEDARLLNATATWSQGAGMDELLRGSSTWGFTFYSPSQGRVATMSVVENQARFLGEGTAPTPLTPLDAAAWQTNSNEVIRILLDQGGREFIQNEGITVLTMSLLADNETPSAQMEWNASLIATENGRSIDMRLSAQTGEILEIVQTP